MEVPRMSLADRGWVRCQRDGDVEPLIGDAPKGPLVVDRCPDCVEGLVPPEGMVEAAAKAIHLASLYRAVLVSQARTALVAAARWERGQ